jgi:hypothetical protein
MKAWLESEESGKWLMIIDNADDTDVFFPQSEVLGSKPGNNEISCRDEGMAKYIPDCPHGAILITTRNKQAGIKLGKGSAKHVFKVEEMDPDESDQLLRIKMDDVNITSHELSALGSRLEYLPLAMAQAASFIQENEMSVTQYLRVLDESDQHLIQLLTENFETDGRDPEALHAVAATWTISFKQISEQNPLAGELLSLMSFFDRQGIPRELLLRSTKFRENEDGDTEPAAGNVENTVGFEKALGILKAFSLISDGKNECLDMHRLVQLVTRKWLELGEGQAIHRFCKQALRTIKDFYSNSFDYEDLAVCSQYLPHALALLKYLNKGRTTCECRAS